MSSAALDITMPRPSLRLKQQQSAVCQFGTTSVRALRVLLTTSNEHSVARAPIIPRVEKGGLA
jgi:hypothetical protein